MLQYLQTYHLVRLVRDLMSKILLAGDSWGIGTYQGKGNNYKLNIRTFSFEDVLLKSTYFFNIEY